MKYSIILVPFPFDDQSGVKVRPAICLTRKIGRYNHVVIAFITSKVTDANEASDLVLRTSDLDFDLTGLKVDSAIRLHRLITIPTRIIKRQLGKLPSHFQAELDRKLRGLFGL